jgi:hypothetical protein
LYSFIRVFSVLDSSVWSFLSLLSTHGKFDLWSLVKAKTQIAKASGALVSIETDYEFIEDGGIEVKKKKRKPLYIALSVCLLFCLREGRNRCAASLLTMLQFIVRLAKNLQRKPAQNPLTQSSQGSPPGRALSHTLSLSLYPRLPCYLLRNSHPPNHS